MHVEDRFACFLFLYKKNVMETLKSPSISKSTIIITNCVCAELEMEGFTGVSTIINSMSTQEAFQRFF